MPELSSGSSGRRCGARRIRSDRCLPGHAFLHIGKTGGGGIKDLIRTLQAQGYRTPASLGHDWTLEGVARDLPDMRIAVIARDPLERIVSGFNSRLRQGEPGAARAWTAWEAAAFERFRAPEDFVRALISTDEATSAAARSAAGRIAHVRRGYAFHFRDPDVLRANADRLYFVGTVDRMEEAVEGIFAPCDLPPGLAVGLYRPRHAAREPSGRVIERLAGEELEQLRRLFAPEYRIYQALVERSRASCESAGRLLERA